MIALRFTCYCWMSVNAFKSLLLSILKYTTIKLRSPPVQCDKTLKVTSPRRNTATRIHWPWQLLITLYGYIPAQIDGALSRYYPSPPPEIGVICLEQDMFCSQENARILGLDFGSDIGVAGLWPLCKTLTNNFMLVISNSEPVWIWKPTVFPDFEKLLRPPDNAERQGVQFLIGVYA